MTHDPQAKPTLSLVNDALLHLTRLVRGEVALAKAEAEEKIRGVAVGIAMIAVAGIFALVALNVIAAAAAAALAETGMEPALAAAIVGGVLALLALILVWRGVSALKPRNLAPSRTVNSLRRDVETLKETISHDA